MDSIDPALFYTGIAATAYGLLRGTGAPDPAPYARFIARSGEPALELGCGDGDPMLALREMGIDVTRVLRATGDSADETDTDIVVLLRRNDADASSQ